VNRLTRGALDAVHRRFREAGRVQKDLLDGDVFFAVGGELGNVVRDRTTDVQHALADEKPDRRCDDRFRRREHAEARVIARGALLSGRERLEAENLVVARDCELARRGGAGVDEGSGRSAEFVDAAHSCSLVPARSLEQMADWATIASLATAGGTLVLAIATFSSTRTANRATRVAEQSLATRIRPLLLNTRFSDPPEKITWMDDHITKVEGGRGVLEEENGIFYLAASVRNVGTGLAVLDSWHVMPTLEVPLPDPDPAQFRRLGRDLFIAAGDQGFWQGAIRDCDDTLRNELLDLIKEPRRFTVDLMYGDQEGGQRVVTRFSFMPSPSGYMFTTVRHWYLDRQGPR
jgi:hypothetical protein